MNIAHYLESAEYMAKRAGAKRLATELRDARWEVNHGYWPEFTAQQSSALRDAIGADACLGDYASGKYTATVGCIARGAKILMLRVVRLLLE